MSRDKEFYQTCKTGNYTYCAEYKHPPCPKTCPYARQQQEITGVEQRVREEKRKLETLAAT